MGKPATIRRSFFQIIREWFTGRTKLIPFCYGQPGCPPLAVGDEVVTITDNESYNIIALGMRLDPTTSPGIVRRWKVISAWDEQDVCLESQNGRLTLTKHLKWSDGNGVRCKPHILHTEMFIRFYKRVPI
jgi:hypothetical protein